MDAAKTSAAIFSILTSFFLLLFTLVVVVVVVVAVFEEPLFERSTDSLLLLLLPVVVDDELAVVLVEPDEEEEAEFSILEELELPTSGTSWPDAACKESTQLPDETGPLAPEGRDPRCNEASLDRARPRIDACASPCGEGV